MTPAAAGKFEPRVGPTEKRCAQCAHLGPICVRLNSADDKTAGPLGAVGAHYWGTFFLVEP